MLLDGASALLRGLGSWYVKQGCYLLLQVDGRLNKRNNLKEPGDPRSKAREEYRWCFCIASILKFVYAIIHVSKTWKCLLTVHSPQTRERIAAVGAACKERDGALR